VDLRFSFSNSKAWLLGGPAEKLPWPGFNEAPGLVVVELMVCCGNGNGPRTQVVLRREMDVRIALVNKDGDQGE